MSSEFGEGSLASEFVDMPDGKSLARLANTQAEINSRYLERRWRLQGHLGRGIYNAPSGRELGKIVDPNGQDLANL